MIKVERLYILVISSSQLLASKTQQFVFKEKNHQKLAISMIFIFLHGKNFTLPYTAPEHVLIAYVVDYGFR